MAAAIIAVVVPLVLASALLFLLSPSAAAPPPREPVELTRAPPAGRLFDFPTPPAAPFRPANPS
nr:unnamed protein product [Digitaria exilis]